MINHYLQWIGESVVQLERGVPSQNEPVDIKIADEELTSNKELSSFGEERTYRQELRSRLDKVKEHRATRLAAKSRIPAVRMQHIWGS